MDDDSDMTGLRFGVSGCMMISVIAPDRRSIGRFRGIGWRIWAPASEGLDGSGDVSLLEDRAEEALLSVLSTIFRLRRTTSWTA